MSHLYLRRIYNVPKPFVSLFQATFNKEKTNASLYFLKSTNNFSNSPILFKKKGKNSSIKDERDEVGEKKFSKSKIATNNINNDDDLWNFTNLKEGIKERIDWLQSELSKLRKGGGFNPDLLENLRIVVQKGSKKTESLGDLAQIIPKGGRSLAIHVGEKAHVKPIISAIQSAAFLNIQPTQDPEEPALLNVLIPPPTKESRDLALKMVHKVGETATTGVRSVRAITQKRLRNIELKKLARPDDLKKAHKEMEIIVEKGIIDIKKCVELARKAIEDK
ncbi:Ribosome-recycling factor, mitochondrial [Erysiphe necator]|nr:Ribosome-recycling factor, mitochondrial [Erysiphe necator]